MDLGLDRRVALVTGGSRGIGRGIAQALSAEGAMVAVAARSPDGVNEAADAVGGRGYAFDSTDLAGIPGLVRTVEEDLGPIDVFVSNTGGPRVDDDPLAYSAEEWEAAHRTLVVCPMVFFRELVPAMRARRFGRILAVSSSTAREPLPRFQLSNANRPGLLSAMKVLARDAARDGVTFNALLPGRIYTQRIAVTFPNREAAEAAARRDVPAGRLGTVEEFGAAAAFLCSAQAGYITGQTLLVDGGLTHAW